ncbi:MAG TPA: alpha/beta hydrolase [Kofleriaceae bacterium]|jgi:pimeloyl-ACP methyl ester carboxylesterase
MKRLVLAIAILVTARAAAADPPHAFRVDVSGEGRPIVLIPGLGCPGTVWQATVAHLGHGWQAHVVTLAGFAGEPPLPAGQPLIATARDQLGAYIRDHHLDHPVIVGHSLGATLAYALAEAFPDLVGPVVAIDGVAFLGAGRAAARTERGDLLAGDRARFTEQVRELFAPMFGNAKVGAAVIADVVKSDRRAFADALYELMMLDLRHDMTRITAPVLALVADGPFAAEISRQAALAPHHEVHVIAKTRHFVMLDAPDATFRALDAFLAAHPPS